jgi:integrase-like protein
VHPAGPTVRGGAGRFVTQHGGPVEAQNVADTFFKLLLDRVVLPPIRWHDLRHTCASLLFQKNIHPKFVQELLGHLRFHHPWHLLTHAARHVQPGRRRYGSGSLRSFPRSKSRNASEGYQLKVPRHRKRLQRPQAVWLIESLGTLKRLATPGSPVPMQSRDARLRKPPREQPRHALGRLGPRRRAPESSENYHGYSAH